MADDKITVSIDLQDDLTPKINQLKGALDGLSQEAVQSGQQIAEGLSKLGISPQQALKMGFEDPKQAEQLKAYVASLQEVKAKTKEVAEGQREAGTAAGGFGDALERMVTRMASRMAILFLLHEALNQIKQAFTEAAQAQEQFVQIQNITGESTQVTSQRFQQLKEIAHSTGEDLEKNVIPTFRKMLEGGMSSEQAVEMTNRLSRVLKETGIDLTNIAAKAETGAASFHDMVVAGNAFGDSTLVKWAHGWEVAQQKEAAYNREMEHTHELTMRQTQDQERLASAHESFAEKTGIAAGAFKAFQEHGARISPTAYIPTSLAEKLPGGRQAFGPLLGELQKHFQEGMQQIAKEENLPLQTVRFGVQAGLPGFDQASLLSAQKRAVEESKIAQQRKDADDRYQRTASFDQARISGNQQIERLLKAQADDTERMAKASGTLADNWKQFTTFLSESRLAVGDIAKAGTQAVTGKAPQTPAERFQQMVAINPPAAIAEYLPAYLAQLFGQKGGGQGTPATDKTLATEGGQDKIVGAIDALSKMLQGTD